MVKQPYSPPTPITDAHRTGDFDCGREDHPGNEKLNEFLQRYALTNQKGGSARTFVVADSDLRVVGYYSLAVTSAMREEVPARVSQGQPNHPIPAVLMARFAVDVTAQGSGLGKALFRDAMLRVIGISEQAGVRVFAVDAKHDKALAFYKHYDGMHAPDDPHRLYWLIKDVRGILRYGQ